MANAGTPSSKRLNFGLGHDEDLSARRAIIGEYKLAPDGSQADLAITGFCVPGKSCEKK
jgi:hypothetical protein